MLAKRGGYAVQRRYRQEGRRPTAAATRVRQRRFQRHQKAVIEAETNRRVQAAVNSVRWKL